MRCRTSCARLRPALGMPRAFVIAKVCYRAAKAAWSRRVLLAVARKMSGETAPLLFTALNNQFFSTNSETRRSPACPRPSSSSSRSRPTRMAATRLDPAADHHLHRARAQISSPRSSASSKQS